LLKRKNLQVRRTKKTLIALSCAATVLAACGSTTSAAKAASSSSTAKASKAPVTITWDTMEYSAASEKQFPEFAKEFEAKNPNIHVKVRVINWSQGLQVLDTEIGANKAPNVAIIGTRWLAQFANSHEIVPIANLVPKSFLDKFIPGPLKSVEYENKIWAVPEAQSVRLLYYNKTLFKKAGITSPPKTWTQLAKDALQIHSKTGASGYALVGSQVETDLDYYYTMWGFGGHILQNNKSALLSKPDMEALNFLARLVKDHGTEPSVTASTRNSLESEFSAGKIGMMIDGAWLYKEAVAAHQNVGVADLPVQPGVKPVNVTINDSEVIFKSSPAKEAASVKFLKFLFTTPIREKFDLTEGMVPVLKGVAALPVFAKSPVYGPDLAALKGPTVSEPTIAKFNDGALAITNAVEAVYDGSLSPKQAFTQATAKINQVLAS
jgi:multiple sugar transport system substrate-binding protein